MKYRAAYAAKNCRGLIEAKIAHLSEIAHSKKQRYCYSIFSYPKLKSKGDDVIPIDSLISFILPYFKLHIQKKF